MLAKLANNNTKTIKIGLQFIFLKMKIFFSFLLNCYCFKLFF